MSTNSKTSPKRRSRSASIACRPQKSVRKTPPRPTTGILKILQCSNQGGMEQVAYSLLREMAHGGDHRFHIATPRPFGKGAPMLRDLDPQCRSFEYKGKFGWRSFHTFRDHVRCLANKSKYIWITGTCASSLAAVRSLPHKKVLSHHYHHFDNRITALRWFGFYQALCRELDVITYPTDFTRNEALRIAPWLRDTAHVVRDGIPLSYTGEAARLQKQAEARRTLNLPEDAFIVGNAGWLISRKRFDVFLHTAKAIREKLPHAYFVICGGGALEEELKILAEELGLGDRIRFTGWIENPAEYYRAWDVCLFNSDLDALGRTPLEAASHGCLTVASVRYGGLSEYLTNDENGILLPTHDTVALAGAVIDLARDADRALRFRQAAAEKLRTHYSIDNSLRFYRSIFA